MSVFAPTGELLFFVWAKKSNQKKAHPTATCILRAEAVANCRVEFIRPDTANSANEFAPTILNLTANSLSKT